MSAFKRTFTFTLIAALCLLAAFFAGYITHARRQTHAERFPVLNEAYDLLVTRGLNPLPTPPAMEYGMLRGMVQAYNDPHTAFLEPVQHELETNALQGSFGGIGVRLGNDDQGRVLLYPFPDGPAAKAGVLEGDRLVGVDGLVITPETGLDGIQAAIRGPVGETVTIKVTRPPDETALEFKVKREEIALPSVTWHLDSREPRLGVLEINIIAASTPDEIKRAITDLQQRGATALVLDLRNNGGGMLDAGIAIAKLFLDSGVVIEQQYRGEDVVTYRVEQPGPYTDIPLAILVNQYTASASEIIGGALQVQKRAVLIGTPTYGKDTIQLVFALQDGSSLHVTAAKWWVPNLEPPIGGHGLQPEILLTPEEVGAETALIAAIQALFPADQ
jgi:carboxyl-terminal processing protease